MKRLLRLSPLLLALLAACHRDLVCPAGEVACGGRCVSLLDDHENCGACGRACGPLEACGAGTCACAAGVATCGGTCTDLARDAAHCGACETACAPAELCTTAEGTTACTASCPAGFTACGRACVELAADRLHCGACGNACAQGQSCRAGACRAEVQVACFATNDVRPVNADLSPAGSPRAAGGSPVALAVGGDALYSANGLPAGVGVLPLDDRLPSSVAVFTGSTDVQDVTAAAGTVLATNASAGTLVVLDGAGRPLDELVLPGTAPNPHGVAVAGTTGWVALYGDGPNGFSGLPTTTGQRIAKIELSAVAACAAPDPAPPACGAGNACPAGRECREGACRVRCGEVVREIDLLEVPGSADAQGYPFPNRVVAAGGRAFVTLSNLGFADLGGGFAGYFRPAGNGKLAIVDAAAGDAVRIVDLGPGCRNPGDLVLQGTTLFVACGSLSFAGEAPGAIVPVDVAGEPVVGSPIDASAIVPGNLAFCGGRGYVTDQGSGRVMRFDPVSRSAEAPVEVCPTVFFALASDVACSL
jgi:hypothetical protein